MTFGPVAVGDSAVATFNVVNQTNADIQVFGGVLDFVNFSYDVFGGSPFTCLEPVVPAGASCTVTVRYAPSGVGEHASHGNVYTSVGVAEFEISGTGLEGGGGGVVRRAPRLWAAPR